MSRVSAPPAPALLLPCASNPPPLPRWVSWPLPPSSSRSCDNLPSCPFLPCPPPSLCTLTPPPPPNPWLTPGPAAPLLWTAQQGHHPQWQHASWGRPADSSSSSSSNTSQRSKSCCISSPAAASAVAAGQEVPTHPVCTTRRCICQLPPSQVAAGCT
jgi:hypothetical protein